VEFWVQLKNTGQAWGGFWPDGFKSVEAASPAEVRTKLRMEIIGALNETWANLKPVPNEIPAEECRKDSPMGWERMAVPRGALIAMTIKRARLGQKVSLGKLARRLDIADTTYRRWEDPFTFNPTLETLEKIAYVLGGQLDVNLNINPGRYGTWADISARDLG
jgi:hypothetical protein